MRMTRYPNSYVRLARVQDLQTREEESMIKIAAFGVGVGVGAILYVMISTHLYIRKMNREVQRMWEDWRSRHPDWEEADQ